MADKPSSLADVRNQALALEYAPRARRNLAILGNDRPGNNYRDEVAETEEMEFPLVDVYVNDACDLRCEFCPTAFGKNNLSPEAVPLIAKLKPRVITLTGGGEPSIYRHGGAQIQDFIGAIRGEMGQIPLGIMTNGVTPMPSHAVDELAWMRVSLNASTQESYADVHKKDRFHGVLSNVVRYLKMGVKKVGIGFVYTPKTIGEIIEFARVILGHILPYADEEEKKKLTLQFRPVADKNYERYVIDPGQQSRLTALMDELPSQARELLERQSNIAEVLSNRCFALQGTFNACYISVLQMNVDAKGDAYPCPQKAHAFEDRYGNIFAPDFFERLKEHISNSYEKHTCAACPTCAQAKINNTFSATDLSEVAFDRPMQSVFF